MSGRGYAERKKSGVAWLGEIPAGWKLAKLKRFSMVQFSNVDKHAVAGEQVVRLCNYSDVYYNEVIRPDMNLMEATATPAEVAKFQLRDGDVLITKDSESWEDIAVPAYVDGDHAEILCGYHLAQIRPNQEYFDGKYLFWSFCAKANNHQFSVAANGITRYALGKYWIENGIFVVPPKAEQIAIAVFLDRKTAQIGALIEKKKQQIALLKEKRIALISHAVTKGLDSNAAMKNSGVAWLGKVPAHWEVRRLKYITQFFYGDSLASESREDGATPVYGSNGQVGVHTESNTNAPCIVIGRKGSFGKVSFCAQSVFAIDTTFFVDDRATDANLLWLFYLLGLLGLDKVSKDSAVPGLNREDAYAKVVPWPPLPEQTAIADFLKKETARIDGIIEKIEKSINLLREHRTALISAAVTGKIDVR